MNKIEFKNLPDITTPLNAENLNTMQGNIEAEIETKISKELASYTGDLNDIKTTGFIYARGTATNIPVSGHFYFLTTIAINENNIYQRATRLIADIDSMLTYERQCVSGTWTEWYECEAKFARNISASTNFDSVTIPGKYYFTSTPSGENKPVAKYGVLEVFGNSGSFRMQRFTVYDGSEVYTRGGHSGNWSEWKDMSAANKVDKTCKTITDWNTATETGFVQTGTGIANGPASVDYAGGFVLKRGTHILQYAIASRTGVMYTRSSLDGTTWQEWKATSQNITTGTEYETGRVIDGKKEYGKFINFGNLGNATNKTVAHGLTNVTFTKIVAHATNGNVSFDTPYGYALSDSNGVSVSCNVQGSYVQVTTNSDRTGYTAVIELNYLKN